ncbi:MAG: hypothetical protein H6683_08975 [Deltaproteobacteria bacterium]|nr:hypothetical protein [Deltaproteobacteria bacterium]
MAVTALGFVLGMVWAVRHLPAAMAYDRLVLDWARRTDLIAGQEEYSVLVARFGEKLLRAGEVGVGGVDLPPGNNPESLERVLRAWTSMPEDLRQSDLFARLTLTWVSQLIARRDLKVAGDFLGTIPARDGATWEPARRLIGALLVYEEEAHKAELAELPREKARDAMAALQPWLDADARLRATILVAFPAVAVSVTDTAVTLWALCDTCPPERMGALIDSLPPSSKAYQALVYGLATHQTAAGNFLRRRKKWAAMLPEEVDVAAPCAREKMLGGSARQRVERDPVCRIIFDDESQKAVAMFGRPAPDELLGE